MGLMRDGCIVRHGRLFIFGWNGFWNAMRAGAVVGVGIVGVNEGADLLTPEKRPPINPMGVHKSAECQNANNALKADGLTKGKIEACLAATQKG